MEKSINVLLQRDLNDVYNRDDGLQARGASEAHQTHCKSCVKFSARFPNT
jgi:hypothetical protein